MSFYANIDGDDGDGEQLAPDQPLMLKQRLIFETSRIGSSLTFVAYGLEIELRGMENEAPKRGRPGTVSRRFLCRLRRCSDEL